MHGGRILRDDGTAVDAEAALVDAMVERARDETGLLRCSKCGKEV